jgi:outer membrane protein OmpA-like peptidoglycan-associated protein
VAVLFGDMKRPLTSFAFLLGVTAVVTTTQTAARAEDPRFHANAGGAHAVGGTQSNEFGAGGVGGGTVELPATSRVGIQASAGALVLSKGDAPKDPTLARTGTGAAFLGTAGVRVRAYGATRVAGPWMDGNVGVAQTGQNTRPTFDAHIGWDFRVSSTSRLDIGPFLGYTQILQPNSAMREDDARVLSAGLSISIGAKERARPAQPVGPENKQPEPPPPPAFEADHDKLAEAVDVCPDGEAPSSDEGCGGEIRVFENRILLDDVVHFEFDSAKIRARSFRLVRRVARFLKEHDDIVDVSIEGHADEIGSEAYNQKLSEDRANSMRELLALNGVERSRLRVVAHGKSHPKIVTLKPEFENRRVELFVTRTREQHGSNAAAAPGATPAFGRNSK